MAVKRELLLPRVLNSLGSVFSLVVTFLSYNWVSSFWFLLDGPIPRSRPSKTSQPNGQGQSILSLHKADKEERGGEPVPLEQGRESMSDLKKKKKKRDIKDSSSRKSIERNLTVISWQGSETQKPSGYLCLCPSGNICKGKWMSTCGWKYLIPVWNFYPTFDHFIPG